MLISTLDTIPGKNFEILALVTSACCLSKSVYGDFCANIKNWTVGGELNEYSNMLEQCTSETIQRLISNAEQINADAIIGLRLVTTEVSSGAAELIAYGTAIRYKGEEFSVNHDFK